MNDNCLVDDSQFFKIGQTSFSMFVQHQLAVCVFEHHTDMFEMPQ